MHSVFSRTLRSVAAAITLATATCTASAQVETVNVAEASARLATGGYVLMMRHARTVAGIGDPPQFSIGDCKTQRNLSREGREQSRRIGEALRAAGIRIDRVRSSQWCRCRDTASLAFGAYEDWTALNSFFGDRSQEPARTREVAEFARTAPPEENIMLVTHQVNIRAVFGVYTSQGEIVAGRWRDGRLSALFRFQAYNE